MPQQQEFPPFGHQPLPRQLVLRHRPARRHRVRGGAQVEACGELHGPKHPQRIFRKRRRRVAQDPLLKIPLPAKRIKQFPGQRVIGHGVDREIATSGGLLDGHVRIGEDLETPMSQPGLRLSTREGDIDRKALHLEDTERLTDAIHVEGTLDHRLDRSRSDAVDLDIEVLAGHLVAGIAHRPTDDQRAPVTHFGHPRDRQDGRSQSSICGQNVHRRLQESSGVDRARLPVRIGCRPAGGACAIASRCARRT